MTGTRPKSGTRKATVERDMASDEASTARVKVVGTARGEKMSAGGSMENLVGSAGRNARRRSAGRSAGRIARMNVRSAWR
jgi:hypothetical protein